MVGTEVCEEDTQAGGALRLDSSMDGCLPKLRWEGGVREGGEERGGGGKGRGKGQAKHS